MKVKGALFPLTNWFYSLFEAILLCLALSVDAFFACISYGALKIKIPVLSAVIISVVCSATLLVSSFFGTLLSSFISVEATKLIAFIILFGIGFIKLFEEGLKALINKLQEKHKSISFSCFNFRFILKVYADAPKADFDSSRCLSALEAVSLSIALSIDGCVCGLGAGIANIPLPELFIISCILTFIMVAAGSIIGRKIAKKLKHDFSFVGGIILMLLGISKLF